MRRSPVRSWIVLPWVVGSLLLAGCSASERPLPAEQAGALAAAQAYVDAIAARDLETAEAMTDPGALEVFEVPSGEADVRSALPEATEPIEDPWVSWSGVADEQEQARPEFVIAVSYRIGDLTGGRDIMVRHEGGDPSDPANWVVTEALAANASTFSAIPKARFGSLELNFTADRHVRVWGYPGGYRLSAPGDPGVKSLSVPLGAAAAPPWQDPLPVLGDQVE